MSATTLLLLLCPLAVDEIYLMGNRLISFLTTTLPQHSQYTSSHAELMEARDEVKAMLVEAGRLLGEVALYLDRLEWDRYQNTAEDEDGDAVGALRRRRNLGAERRHQEDDENHLEDDEEGSDGTNSESCSDDEEGSELESILEEANEDEDETDSDVDAQDDRPKRPEEESWEADFSSTANAFDLDGPTTCTVPVTPSPSTPTTHSASNTATSPTKPISSILQTPTATPTPKPPRKKNRHRRVKFSPDVKPGKHHPHPPPPAIQHANKLAGDDNVGDEDYEDCEDYHHAPNDEQDGGQDDLADERNLSLSIEEEEHRTFLQMTQMEFVDGGSFDDGDANDEDVGEDEDDAIDAGDNALAVPADGDAAGREERTTRRRKAWEIVRARSGTGNDTGNGDREEIDPIDDGDLDDDDEDDDDDDDASIDDDAVLAAATDGIPLSPVHSPSRPTRRHDTVDQVDQALSDLTKATEALSVRVRRFETEEVDDVPTDEEHTDDEGAANDVDDEFATAPGINDLSRSSILYESDNETREDDHSDGSTEGQGHDIEDPEDLKRYRSNQDAASEGSSSPISERLSFMHAVAIQNFHSDFHRSMAVEDDEDEIMAQRRLHEDHDDDHDSDAADSWAQDGGDGDDDDDFDTTSASENGDGRHDFGGDGFLQSELGFDGPLPAFPSDGRDPFFLDKEAPWPDRVEEFDPFDVDTSHAADGSKTNRARAESGASGTDADETAQTMPSSSNSYDYSGDLPSLRLGTNLAKQDTTVPDKLDYLESKLRALKQERLSEDHVVGDDEVEV